MSFDLEELSAPFRGTQISWRVGATVKDKSKGLPLAYIDARDVMERLDEVCGPANWQARYSHAEKRVICELSIRIGDEWVVKSNGAGDTDVEADKGAISDAFKRAAVLWGIGRYLYGLKAGWMPIQQQGRSYVLTDRAKGQLVEIHEKFVGGTVVPMSDKKKSKASSRPIYDKVQAALDGAVSLDDLEGVWNESQADRRSLPKDWQSHLIERVTEIRDHLKEKAA